MKHQSRFIRPALLAATTLCATGHLSAQSYPAILLETPNAYTAMGRGASGQYAVGTQQTDHVNDAYLWNLATGSAVNLSPKAQTTSIAYGASSDIGLANEHAALWHGTAASYIDLNSAGFYTSQVYGVSGNNQAAGGGPQSQAATGGFRHALLWHVTAASAIDLNPAGYIGSNASNVDGNSIVGIAVPNNRTSKMPRSGRAPRTPSSTCNRLTSALPAARPSARGKTLRWALAFSTSSLPVHRTLCSGTARRPASSISIPVPASPIPGRTT